MKEWLDATSGWGSSNFDEYVTHYNQKVTIFNKLEGRFQVFWQQATASDPYGKGTELLKPTSPKKLPIGDSIQLTNTGTVKLDTGTYYLKGVRYVSAGETEKHFYITQSLTGNPTFVTNNQSQTKNYSKRDGSGSDKNTFIGKSVNVGTVYKYATKDSKGNSGVLKSENDEKTPSSKEPLAKGSTPSGKMSYTELVSYMKNIRFKNHSGTDKIYLIYEKLSGTGKISLTNNVYKWNDDANAYQADASLAMSKTAQANVGGDFSVKGLSDAWDSFTKTNKKVGGITFFLKTISIHYYKQDGTEDTQNFDVGEVWDGKTEEKSDMKSEAENVIKQAVVKSVAEKSMISVTLDYYQPTTVYRGLQYFKHKVNVDGAAKMRWNFIHVADCTTTTEAQISSNSGNTNYGQMRDDGSAVGSTIYVLKPNSQKKTVRILARSGGTDEKMTGAVVKVDANVKTALEALGYTECEPFKIGNKWVTRYEISLADLTSKLYGETKDGDYYQITGHDDIMKLMVDGKLKDEEAAYKNKDNATKADLTGNGFKLDLDSQYVADATFKGYYNAEQSSFLTAGNLLTKSLPANSGRAYSNGKFDTSYVKGSVGVALYKEHVDKPTLKVNIHVGMGSKSASDLTASDRSSIKWIDQTITDQVIDNTDSKQSVTVKIQTSLAAQLENRLIGMSGFSQADADKYQFLPKFATEKWKDYLVNQIEICYA